MKNAVREYLNLTNDEKEKLWKNATFIFDTNIFLNLYRYTAETRDSLLKAMKQLSDRIWMPKQVAQELMKDRPKVILDTLKIFDDIQKEKNKFIEYCTQQLRRKDKDKKIEEFSREIDKNILEFKKESSFVQDVNNDKILKQLLELFAGKVGAGFGDEDIKKIREDGKIRYEKKVPPGYKDCEKGEQNNSFGDLIIWEEIIEFSKQNKKNVIYVTGDQKEDWWHRVAGKTLGPRVELKKEFFDETKREFYMYNMESFLEQAKKLQGTDIEQKVIDEVKSYEIIHEEERRRRHMELFRIREAERLEKRRMEIKAILQELDQREKEIQLDLNGIENKLEIEEELAKDTFIPIEILRDYTEKMRKRKMFLEDIRIQKSNCLKELDELNRRKHKFFDFDERREKYNDQL